jgi:hypothetical protein
MGALPAWLTAQFGCLIRDASQFRSLMRTAVTANLPVPFVSRKGDTSAPVVLAFGIEVDSAGYSAWVQWYTYDLADGSLPFTLPLPWGTSQIVARARLSGNWYATRAANNRWAINGTAEIDRASLPHFSGGANA